MSRIVVAFLDSAPALVPRSRIQSLSLEIGIGEARHPDLDVFLKLLNHIQVLHGFLVESLLHVEEN